MMTIVSPHSHPLAIAPVARECEPMTSCTCVIVTYNSQDEIGNLLGDLENHVPTCPVIVIDNASQDGSANLISSRFPFVHLARNRENVGYARAANQGAAMCKTPYILLLNPDIRFPEGRVFAEMLAFMESHPEAAAAAPLQFKEHAQRRFLNFTWSHLSTQAFKFYLEQRFGGSSLQTEPIRVQFLNAGCLMLRRSAFEQVGKFDERYFLYGEEPDLFLKFMRYGYECRLLPNIHINHYRERSIGKLELLKRLSVRVLGVRNILHALFYGWGNIILDYLTRRLAPERSHMPPR